MIWHPSLSSALLLFSLAVVPRIAPPPPPPPRLLPLGTCRPFPPSSSSLSLSTARPTHIRSPVVFLPAWCFRYSPSLSVFPSSRSASSSSFLWSRGGCGCTASFWGYHFPGYLDSYTCAAPSPAHAPTSAWPPSLPPPPPFPPALLGVAADPLLLAASPRLFRQNTYLQNKKHTLTCQGGDWFLQI